MTRIRATCAYLGISAAACVAIVGCANVVFKKEPVGSLRDRNPRSDTTEPARIEQENTRRAYNQSQLMVDQNGSSRLPPVAALNRNTLEKDGGAIRPTPLASLPVGRHLAEHMMNKALPPCTEELWIIKKVMREPIALDDAVPAGCELRARLKPDLEVPIPLEHTDVKASIAAYIATVEVAQQYRNPYSEKIEAVYVFPLPENAAVNEFMMTIGERRIRGIIREREEAEQVYQEARRQGYVASLLTQERPNVFTQSVANIEPGHRIDINLKYFHTLGYDDGWYEFVFPMVVGPRFNPPGATGGTGAVARGQAGLSGQSTEVQYLRPGERSAHDISVEVGIDAGVMLEDVRSINHKIDVQRPTDSQAVVSLDPNDTLPNKDFVLRYKVAGERIKTALLTHRDERGGFFSLMIYPPDELRDLPRGPMEMIFVLDCSGSMNGRPIEQAKAAIAHALNRMRPEDTFQIINFSNQASQLGPAPLAATRENLKRGRRYLDELRSEGGTMMVTGIKAALDFPHDPKRLRTVAFLTDGFIGNEAETLAEVDHRLGDSRIFSFGVGSAPNRYLLDGLARIGRGAVAYLSLNDDAAEVMDAYFERVSRAALTDVSIDWGGLAATETFPQRVPDLVVGRPVVVTGRFQGVDATRIGIRGQAAGTAQLFSLPVEASAFSVTHSALPAVWARHKIADLTFAGIIDAGSNAESSIRTVALEYGLMSNYTAFVAVDSIERTWGDHGTQVSVPVPVPEGVKYETTIEDRSAQPSSAEMSIQANHVPR